MRKVREIFERERFTDSRSSLRHIQVAKARAEFGEENHYATHIYVGNYKRSGKASSVQIGFLLLRVDLRWEYVSTLPE